VGNPGWAIRWFQDYLWTWHREAILKLPGVTSNPGANLWIERLGND
jgi:hypothetical protein